MNLKGPDFGDLKQFAKKHQWVIIITIIVIIVGTIFHFLYEWTGDNPLIGVFSSVNESVYEHLKLIFFPLIIAALIQYYFTKQNNLAPGILIGSLVGIIFTVVMFYTYIGAITHPKNYFVVDISIFIIAAILACITASWIFKKNQFKPVIQLLAFAIIVGGVIEFAIYTNIPPNIPLFTPPSEDH